MASEKKSSFKQFDYCSFCRFSHKKGKKHLYSLKHQTIINNILEKLRKKIMKARHSLTDPEVESLSCETGAKFWCYFCSEDCVTHSVLDICILKYGGLLEHIASKSHELMTNKFFRDNRIDETKQDRKVYILTSGTLISFQRAAAVNVRNYAEIEKQKNIQVANQLRKKEMRSKIISQWEPEKSDSQQNVDYDTYWKGKSQLPDDSIRDNVTMATGISTLSAHGEGLTFIGPQDFDVEAGNVHTGGMPPWLRTEESRTTRDVIGPTLSDYEKHLAREKKKKLPPCRVGANLDRNWGPDVKRQGSQWLPSFGRVWNKGRRQQSKIFFQQELRKSVKSSTTTSINQSQPTNQKQGYISDVDKQITVPSSDASRYLSVLSYSEGHLKSPPGGEKNLISSRSDSYPDTESLGGEVVPKMFSQDMQPYRKKRKHISQNASVLYSHNALDTISHGALCCDKNDDEILHNRIHKNWSTSVTCSFQNDKSVSKVRGHSDTQCGRSWDTATWVTNVNPSKMNVNRHEQFKEESIFRPVTHPASQQSVGNCQDSRKDNSCVSLTSFSMLPTPILNKSQMKPK